MPVIGGRRPQFLLLFVTALFLIIAVPIGPIFFLGLVGGMLLVSRPRTRREWLWIVVCAAVLALWFQLPSSLSQQTIRASGVFYVGAFLALSLAGVRSLFTRALTAVAIAAVLMVGWYALYHLRFADLHDDIVTQTWNAWRQLRTDLPATPPPPAVTSESLDAGTDAIHTIAASVTAMASLYPAILALVALAGTWLASTWYHRISASPITEPAASLDDFRFNDHLIWLLVLGVGAMLLRVPNPFDQVAGNVLLVVITVYALRGLGVLRSSLRRASPLFMGCLALLIFPMFAFIITGLILLGVADTWIDFRRRMQPPSGAPS